MAGPAIGRWRKATFATAAVVVFAAGLELIALTLAARTAPTSLASASDTDWLLALRADLGAGASLYRSDPHLLWRLVPSTRASFENTVFESRGEPLRWSVTINQDGQRGPRYPRGESPVIAALGDSCTFGFRVGDEHTWPAQLERLLNASGRQPGTRVVNYAVPGYTSFQGLRLLREVLARHRPGTVVLAFGANDHEEDRYSDAERAQLVGSLRFRLAAVAQRSATVRLLTQALGRGDRRSEAATGGGKRRVSANDYRDNMRAMVKLAQASGARPVILDLVFVAPIYRYINESLAAELGVPFIDGRVELRRAVPRLEGGDLNAERERIDRFWSERVKAYRRVYFDDAYYERLLGEPPWPVLLRYFMVEPVHANELGNGIIAQALGSVITAPTSD